MTGMKKYVIAATLFLVLSGFLLAQKGEPYRVLSGKKPEECIPFAERYRYPNFNTGTVFFTLGGKTDAKLNYNILTGQMDYLQGKDTMEISNAPDIKQIIIGTDVFVLDKGYLEVFYNGKVAVGIKQYFNLMDVRKKDFYGDMGAGAASQSAGSLHSDGKYYKLVVNQDRLFQKITEYFLSTATSGFVPFTRKKVMKAFPNNKQAIEVYLGSNQVNFNSKDDLLRFAAFLESIE
jgi:hypothetical protein